MENKLFSKQEIRLLLVDKNLSYLEAAKGMLDNCIVDVATSGKECLEKLSEQNYDLLLLDYDIDEKKGLNVLEEIIRHDNKLPVLILVDEGSEDIAFEALEKGAFDYIMKVRGYLTALPFSVGKVLERQKLTEKRKDRPFPTLSSIPSKLDEFSFILDRRGRFISANKKLEMILEYTELELLELTLLDLIAREQESKYTQWLSTLDSGYSVNSFKTELIGKYGNREDVEIFLNPVRNENGEIISYKGKLIFIRSVAEEEIPTNGFFDQGRMIQETLDIINSSYDESVGHLLERITKRVCQLFKFKRATLALLDRRRKVFVKQAMVGFMNRNGSDNHILEVPQDVIEKAFEDQHKAKIMYFEQNWDNSSLPKMTDRQSQPHRIDQKWNPKDFIILNLMDKKNRTFGYISLDSPEFNTLPSKEMFYNLELFSSLASLAIENYYRLTNIEKRNRRLVKQLLITGNIFKLHQSSTEMLNEFVWSVKFSLDFNLVMLCLISKSSGKLEIKSVACDDKIKAIQIKELKFSISSFRMLSKKQYRRGKSYFIDNEEPVLKPLKDIYYRSKIHTSEETNFWPWWALLLVPIRSSENKIMGFLMVDDPVDFLISSAETIHTLEVLAHQVSVAIENRMAYLQLKENMLENDKSFELEDIKPKKGLMKFMNRYFK